MPKREHTDPGADGIMQGRTFLERVGDTPSQRSRIDPHPASGEPARGLLDEQPALRRTDWLPEGLFPELDELRAEHLTFLAGGWGDAKQSLLDTYEAEDEARAEALRLGNDAPAVTPTAERQDRLGEAEAERQAGRAKFDDFIARALAEIAKLAPDWREQFAQMATEADRKRAEAAALLAAAEREVSRVARSELWLDRTIKPRSGRYVGAPDLGPLLDVDELMEIGA